YFLRRVLIGVQVDRTHRRQTGDLVLISWIDIITAITEVGQEDRTVEVEVNVLHIEDTRSESLQDERVKLTAQTGEELSIIARRDDRLLSFLGHVFSTAGRRKACATGLHGL